MRRAREVHIFTTAGLSFADSRVRLEPCFVRPRVKTLKAQQCDLIHVILQIQEAAIPTPPLGGIMLLVLHGGSCGCTRIDVIHMA